MLVSVSAQANASLETWGQKLDLTIPSLEMPSTSVLDSRDKQEIMMGWTCCYRKELINSVRLEHSMKSTEYWSRGNPKKLLSTPRYNFQEPIHPSVYATFWLLQIADVWTTHHGLKYDCVYEANPLLPRIPHTDRLLIHKIIFLSPFDTLYDEGLLTYENMIFPIFLTSYVVHNNLKVRERAKRLCDKR